MNNIESVSGSAVPLLLDDIDTDRIIPARFLRCVTFDGIGEHAFEDDRKQDANHPFNQERFQNGSILVSGRNFGCGSSREHAPQSLMRWGVKAVVAESFAEIFFGNCTSLGIPCEETEIPVARFLAADEVFITSTAGGVMPATRIESHILGNGAPGPITRQLDDAYLALHRDERYLTPVSYDD